MYELETDGHKMAGIFVVSIQRHSVFLMPHLTNLFIKKNDRMSVPSPDPIVKVLDVLSTIAGVIQD